MVDDDNNLRGWHEAPSRDGSASGARLIFPSRRFELRQGGDEDEPDEDEPDEDEPDEDEPDENEGGPNTVVTTTTISPDSTNTSPTVSSTSTDAGSASAESKSTSSNNARSIALGVIIPLIVLCIVALAFCYRKRRRNKKFLRDARDRRMRDPLLPTVHRRATAERESKSDGSTTLAPHALTSRGSATAVLPHTSAHDSSAPTSPPRLDALSDPASPIPLESSQPLLNPHSIIDYRLSSSPPSFVSKPPSAVLDTSPALDFTASPTRDDPVASSNIPAALQPGGGRTSPPTRTSTEEWLPSRFYAPERNLPELYYRPSLDRLAADSQDHIARPPSDGHADPRAMAVAVVPHNGDRARESTSSPTRTSPTSVGPSSYSVDEKGRMRLSWRRVSSRGSGGRAGANRHSSLESHVQGRESQGLLSSTMPASASTMTAPIHETEPSSSPSRRRSAPPQVDKALPFVPPASSSEEGTSAGAGLSSRPLDGPSAGEPCGDNPSSPASAGHDRHHSFDAIGGRSPFFEYVAAAGQDPMRAKKGKRDSVGAKRVVRQDTRLTVPPAYSEAVVEGSRGRVP
ncbi:hypothetical protein BD626DRAFT_514071 [Schizophyllum amplum]|uniref:Uncharacterized protein n=1 Tax=Schizophyllum amplum TaxID=97359 RepID=A0A550BYK8_9AGAR|nr:hypothetical protein BD626DRAFT_514071 [Auriculariopsis ampla]